MKRALLFSLALASAVSAPAAAAPNLPPGWSAGSPAAADPPPPPSRSRRALLERLSRPGVTRSLIPSVEIPGIEIAPVPTSEPARSAVPSGELAAELFVTPDRGRASVRGHRYGWIKVDWVQRPIGPQSGGGVSLWHVRPDIRRWKPAEWQTLDADEHGQMTYQRTWAWFDVDSCKATVVERDEVVPRPFAGGLAYAFRTHCPACAPGKQEILHVLTLDGMGALQDAELPIDAGTNGAVVFEVSADAIGRFRRSGARPDRTTAAMIGVDVQRGVSDSEPVVTAFVTDLPVR
jgi:hypothetical protein